MPEIRVRDAVIADLPAVVSMLADDPLGSTRESAARPLDDRYLDAFEAIAASPHIRLLVAEEGERIVGGLQLLVLPGIARHGAWRGQIEAVRVASDCRGRGIGHKMVRWAVEECRARGCSVVQLTSNVSRADAHRFWRKLGFEDSHRGFKLVLSCYRSRESSAGPA